MRIIIFKCKMSAFVCLMNKFMYQAYRWMNEMICISDIQQLEIKLRFLKLRHDIMNN